MGYETGYASMWRVRRIDPDTWTPIGVLDGVDSVTVQRAVNDGSSPLLESGSMEVSGDVEEGYYRIEMRPSLGEMVTVATLLFCPDGRKWSHRAWGGKASGRSVLAPASVRMCRPGQQAPMGVDGAAWCASRLREVIKAPVVVEGSFRLGEFMSFESSDSVLDAVWSVLKAVGWCIQIAGDGTVTLRELPTEPDLVICAENLGLLMPEFESSLPIESVPNSLTVYKDGRHETWTNEDPSSPTSVPSRNDMVIEAKSEEDPTCKEGESLLQYAKRRLEELADVYETIDVEREWADGVHPYSTVRSNMPESGVTGDFRVMSQKLKCGAGIKVSETWGRRAS